MKAGKWSVDMDSDTEDLPRTVEELETEEDEDIRRALEWVPGLVDYEDATENIDADDENEEDEDEEDLDESSYGENEEFYDHEGDYGDEIHGDGDYYGEDFYGDEY